MPRAYASSHYSLRLGSARPFGSNCETPQDVSDDEFRVIVRAEKKDSMASNRKQAEFALGDEAMKAGAPWFRTVAFR